MRFSIILLCCAVIACGGEPIAVWSAGHGRIAEREAAAQAAVLAGETVHAGPEAPAFLAAREAPGVLVSLAPSSSGAFAEETADDGQRRLIFELHDGAVEVEVQARGPYAAVLVRGAALELEVQGTLFVVERTRADADYAVLVRGSLRARLRAEIARLLGRAGDIELQPQQGLGAGTQQGLLAPVALPWRPQITAPAAQRAPIQAQATGQAAGGTGWDADRMAALRQNLLAAGAAGAAVPTTTFVADAALATGTDAAPAFAGSSSLPLAGADMLGVFADVALDLVASLAEIGAPVTAPLTDHANAAAYEAAVQAAAGLPSTPPPAPTPLPLPPGPPSF